MDTKTLIIIGVIVIVIVVIIIIVAVLIWRHTKSKSPAKLIPPNPIITPAKLIPVPIIVNRFVAGGSLPTPTYTGSFYLQFAGSKQYITSSGIVTPLLSDAGKFSLSPGTVKIPLHLNGSVVQAQGFLQSDKQYGDKDSTSNNMVLSLYGTIGTGFSVNAQGSVVGTTWSNSYPAGNFNSTYLVNAIAV